MEKTIIDCMEILSMSQIGYKIAQLPHFYNGTMIDSAVSQSYGILHEVRLIYKI